MVAIDTVLRNKARVKPTFPDVLTTGDESDLFAVYTLQTTVKATLRQNKTMTTFVTQQTSHRQLVRIYE